MIGLDILLFVWLAGALGTSLWMWALSVPFSVWALPWIAVWPALVLILLVAAVCSRLNK